MGWFRHVFVVSLSALVVFGACGGRTDVDLNANVLAPSNGPSADLPDGFGLGGSNAFGFGERPGLVLGGRSASDPMFPTEGGAGGRAVGGRAGTSGGGPGGNAPEPKPDPVSCLICATQQCDEAFGDCLSEARCRGAVVRAVTTCGASGSSDFDSISCLGRLFGSNVSNLDLLFLTLDTFDCLKNTCGLSCNANR